MKYFTYLFKTMEEKLERIKDDLGEENHILFKNKLNKCHTVEQIMEYAFNLDIYTYSPTEEMGIGENYLTYDEERGRERLN